MIPNQFRNAELYFKHEIKYMHRKSMTADGGIIDEIRVYPAKPIHTRTAAPIRLIVSQYKIVSVLTLSLGQ